MGESARPDAVLIPSSFKRGANSRQRIHSILDIAEPLLEVDKASGERAYYRSVPLKADDGTGYNLASRGLHDTLLQPKGHPKQGQSRYRWEPGEDGIRLGYLVEPEVILGRTG